MGYVEQHLLAGEKVMYRAHLHWAIFILPAILTILMLVFLLLASATAIVWLLGVVVAALFWIHPLLKYHTSEFAVTNKRVIVKVGLVQRDSSETLLSKVEAIQVDQTIPGRMLNFGTITITGTGGTKESFPRIAAPMEFRRQVQAQIVDMEDRRVGAGSAAPAVATGPRDERECPYCAEKILKKAKVCRYCGREVAPIE